MTCRERAGQVRNRQQDFVDAGIPIVAIGTGGKRYAKAFIADENFPFPVLLDEEGIAADIIETNSIGATTYLSPKAVSTGVMSFVRGHRQKKTGRRPLQLGATLVIGPGDKLLFADFEDHAGDHADLDEVLAAAK
ncbi:MAG: redoxin domain-containing protein [bacterium]|nr:redoxin domain-containing protein [bacterium]